MQNHAFFEKTGGGMNICKKLLIIFTIIFAFTHLAFGTCATSGAPRGGGDLGNNPGAMAKPNGPTTPQICPFGSPTWSVNMVNLNLYVLDIPIWYTPSIGPFVEISLNYNSQAAITGNESFGNKWQMGYKSSLTETNNDVLISMPDSRKVLFEDNGNGGYDQPYKVNNTLSKIGPDHFELKFPNGMVYAYQIPSGTSATHPYLTQIRDAYNQSLTLSYNSANELISITDATGKTTTISYTSGKITSVADPFGRAALFEYDIDNNLSKITDMGGYWTSLEYDDNSYLTLIENSRGKTKFYIEPSDTGQALSYPAPGEAMQANYRITVTDPMNNKEEYYYNGRVGYGWYVSPNDYVEYVDFVHSNASYSVPKTYYYYDTTSKGIREEIKTIEYPEGGIISYTYDFDTGQRTSVTDSSANTTEYAYNESGLPTYIKNAKDVETEFTYDENKIDLLEMRTFKGADIFSHTTMTYNAAHDVTSITDVLTNRTTQIAYNGYGQVISTINPLLIEILNTYNGNHQLAQVQKDNKIIETYTYDPIGRIQTRTDATGIMLTYEYSDLNHITKVSYPDGKFITKTYSSCCPRIVDAITDRSGKTVNYIYDASKRLTHVIDQGQTEYRYDSNGNLTQLIDANKNITIFNYDKNNRLIERISADNKSTKFRYNDDNLLISRTDARNIETQYTYDETYNLVRVSYSDDTPEVVYTYDDYNRVVDIQDATGSNLFEYYPDSMLKTVNGPYNNDTITYAYDQLGRIIGVTPDSGQATSYVYDTINRLTTIQTDAGNFSYDYKSDVSPIIKTLTHPNSLSVAYEYNTPLNQLTKISNTKASSEIINQYEYTYQNDRIASETITDGEPITTFQEELVEYDYNPANQLVKTVAPEKLFAYDDAGNMTQGYTAEGFMFTAAYDAENQLKIIEYTDNEGVAHKTEYVYAYNKFLAQIKTYTNNTLTNDARILRNGHLALQERDQANTIVREYTWGTNMGGGIGGLLDLKQNEQHYSYLYDGKGNITAITDAAQTLAAAYRYDAFGVLMTQTGSLDQPFAFSTKRYNASTGLNYYGYRFYGPKMGRWLTQDPIGVDGGINLYGFVQNDPVNLIDPEGESFTLAALGALAIAGYIAYKANEFVKQIDPTKRHMNKPYEDLVKAVNDPNGDIVPDPQDFKKGFGEVGKLVDKGSQLSDAINVGVNGIKSCPILLK